MNGKAWVLESDNDGVEKVFLNEQIGKDMLLDRYIKLLENDQNIEVSQIITDLKGILNDDCIPEYLYLYSVDLVE